jgi:hypothetical protein
MGSDTSIERQMNAWFHVRTCFLYKLYSLTENQECNQQYIVIIEVYFVKAFSSDPAKEGDNPPCVDINASHSRVSTNHLQKCF